MWDTRGGGESSGLGQIDVLFKKKHSDNNSENNCPRMCSLTMSKIDICFL